jgi:hypothetical protein
MPVPDTVCFGPATDGGSLNYGQVRALPEEEQFLALNRRFDSFFVNQVNELARIENGKRLVYSPFPLFLMTCVGIETLGKILFTRAPAQNESEEDVQRLGFLKVCGGIDAGFPRALNKVQKQEYDQLWGANEHNKITCVAHIIYRLGRHTLVHGYRGKGVYITEDEAVPQWTMEGGAVALNPYWFWKKFTDRSAELWKEFHANKEPTNALKRSARGYLSEVLN